ncbi:hypothetical protein ACFL5K_02150 [Gemmatimonadota bacterium]
MIKKIGIIGIFIIAALGASPSSAQDSETGRDLQELNAGLVPLELPPPGIVSAEFFIDNDPGFGSGIPIPITPGQNIDEVLTVDISGISDGAHMLYVRIEDENGLWSLTSARAFLKFNVYSHPNIVSAEFFIDNDPGFGSGTSIPITQGLNIDEVFTVGISEISDGAHMLYVRTKDENGLWSLTSARAFLKFNVYSHPNIVSIEYYFQNENGKTPTYSYTEFDTSGNIDVQFMSNYSGLSESDTFDLHTNLIDENGLKSLDYVHEFAPVIIFGVTAINHHSVRV